MSPCELIKSTTYILVMILLLRNKTHVLTYDLIGYHTVIMLLSCHTCHYRQVPYHDTGFSFFCLFFYLPVSITGYHFLHFVHYGQVVLIQELTVDFFACSVQLPIIQLQHLFYLPPPAGRLLLVNYFPTINLSATSRFYRTRAVLWAI